MSQTSTNVLVSPVPQCLQSNNCSQRLYIISQCGELCQPITLVVRYTICFVWHRYYNTCSCRNVIISFIQDIIVQHLWCYKCMESTYSILHFLNRHFLTVIPFIDENPNAIQCLQPLWLRYPANFFFKVLHLPHFSRGFSSQ